MSQLNEITEKIVNEVLQDTENMLWRLARTTLIPGFDADDLMQEMRIKIWQTIREDKYDPERIKPTSFYYRVCKNHLINLNKSKIYKYNNTLPKDREYRDCLDQKDVLLNDSLPQIGGYQDNFVQEFTDDFIKRFF